MYSGITANNPGQKYECEHALAPTRYNYFLVSMRNSTSNSDSFTGLCAPAVCDKPQIEEALQALSIKTSQVYDYPTDPPSDPLFVLAAVIVGIWVGVLVIWSVIRSFKEPLENDLIKKHE